MHRPARSFAGGRVKRQRSNTTAVRRKILRAKNPHIPGRRRYSCKQLVFDKLSIVLRVRAWNKLPLRPVPMLNQRVAEAVPVRRVPEGVNVLGELATSPASVFPSCSELFGLGTISQLFPSK
jgi:hypothetical protein